MKTLLNNWELKILALLTAIIFWLFVLGSENSFFTYNKPIPIKAFNLSQNLVLSEELGEATIRLKVDSQESVKNVSVDDFNAYVDLQGLTEGEREVAVEVSSKRPDVTVAKVEPARVLVKLVPISEKELEVKPEISGELAEGYQIDETILKTEKVLVKGAQSALDEAQKAVIFVELNGEDVDIKRFFDVKAVDSEGNIMEQLVIEPSQIEADINISSSSGSKLVGIKPNVIGSPPENTWIQSVNVEPAFIEVSGSAEHLNQLTFLETEPIDVSSFTGDQNITVAISGIPQEVKVDGETNVLVSIDVQTNAAPPEPTNNSTTQTLSASFKIVKLRGNQRNVTFDPKSINVSLNGDKSVIDSLKKSLQVNVDVSVLSSPGTIQITPDMLNLPADVFVDSINPSSVFVSFEN